MAIDFAIFYMERNEQIGFSFTKNPHFELNKTNIKKYIKPKLTTL